MRVDDAISGNITIGRFGGVEVRVNWGLFVVVFALIVWSSADGVFPSRNPGLSHGVHLAMVLVAAALFFASVLLHELGHVSPLHDLPGSGGAQAGCLLVFGSVAALPRSSWDTRRVRDTMISIDRVPQLAEEEKAWTRSQTSPRRA